MIEAASNAMTGYAVVVLSVICFLLTLVIIVAGIRVIAGSAPTATTAAAAPNAHVPTATMGKAV